MTQVVGDRDSVDRAGDPRVPRERLGRRREEEVAGLIGIEARMHAVGIARAEQEVLAAVPDDQCEEALDSFEHSFSPAQIGIEDERRVGRRREGEVIEPLAARVEKPVEQHRDVAVARDAVRRAGTGTHLEPLRSPLSQCGEPGAGGTCGGAAHHSVRISRSDVRPLSSSSTSRASCSRSTSNARASCCSSSA